MIWSSILISKSSHWTDDLCLDPIIMSSVLASCILTEPVSFQSTAKVNSGVKVRLSSVNVLADNVRLVSSVNILGTASSRELGRSLI